MAGRVLREYRDRHKESPKKGGWGLGMGVCVYVLALKPNGILLRTRLAEVHAVNLAQGQ